MGLKLVKDVYGKVGILGKVVNKENTPDKSWFDTQSIKFHKDAENGIRELRYFYSLDGGMGIIDPADCQDLGSPEQYQIDKVLGVYFFNSAAESFKKYMESINGEYTLTIKGFKTKEQAEQFAQWYSGAGEDDASLWFFERKVEGIIDVDFMPADVDKMYGKWEDFKDNNLDFYLKIDS